MTEDNILHQGIVSDDMKDALSKFISKITSFGGVTIDVDWDLHLVRCTLRYPALQRESCRDLSFRLIKGRDVDCLTNHTLNHLTHKLFERIIDEQFPCTREQQVKTKHILEGKITS